MKPDRGPEIIFHYFQSLDSLQRQRIDKLADLYHYWNQRINVISRKDFTGFYQNHVLHSLGIAKIRQFTETDKVLDIGTGGGFPGIPLAILFPETSFHLVDSIGKKIKVVQEIAQELGLENVTCEQKRAEELKGSYQVAVTRAVAQLRQLITWFKPTMEPGSQLLCLKGGDLENEINEAGEPALVYHLNDFFQEPFFETKKVLVVDV